MNVARAPLTVCAYTSASPATALVCRLLTTVLFASETPKPGSVVSCWLPGTLALYAPLNASPAACARYPFCRARLKSARNSGLIWIWL
jgi:hypothetical protein